MKKILLFSLFCLVSTTSPLSAQRIRVYSGDLKPIAGEKEIGVVFTYDNMQVGKLREADYIERKVADYNKDEAGRGDIWRENWVKDRQARFEPKFHELFAKYMSADSKSGGMALVPDNGGSGETKFLLKINTDFTEPGFNIGIMRQNAAITLSIDVVERETGERIARVVVENASANSFSGMDFDTGFRIQECYAKAGRELAKFLIKNLKL